MQALKIWEWMYLFFMAFMFPILNILINYFFITRVTEQIYLYIILIVITVIFSLSLFFNFNIFRKRTGLKRSIDAAFLLYIFSVIFGSLFITIGNMGGIFIIPFLMTYFFEILQVLKEFPKD